MFEVNQEVCRKTHQHLRGVVCALDHRENVVQVFWGDGHRIWMNPNELMRWDKVAAVMGEVRTKIQEVEKQVRELLWQIEELGVSVSSVDLMSEQTLSDRRQKLVNVRIHVNL